jgi:hypothetical protein
MLRVSLELAAHLARRPAEEPSARDVLAWLNDRWLATRDPARRSP